MKFHWPFKHSLYGYPVDTGTLHYTLFNTFRDHMVAKCDQLFCKNFEFMLDFFSISTKNTAKNTIFAIDLLIRFYFLNIDCYLLAYYI